MSNRPLPLLSDSFRKVLDELNAKYDSGIGKHLAQADLIVNGFDNFCPNIPSGMLPGFKSEYIK
jgi:hypothetical protein